ncbi:MAG: NAD(P)/FAD-dependent oxidoreductase [Bacilli bacterium]|nr:NAD(P)/FAD-dependent oxidoreductase [Bacilli bacterium]
MKVICIGAGAAGLFFALNASSKGVEVLVLDSNSKPGRKLAITGKGRCNITNKKLPREFLDHVVRNNNFLYSSLNALPHLTQWIFLKIMDVH